MIEEGKVKKGMKNEQGENYALDALQDASGPSCKLPTISGQF
jgi:hypothetical protein